MNFLELFYNRVISSLSNFDPLWFHLRASLFLFLPSFESHRFIPIMNHRWLFEFLLFSYWTCICWHKMNHSNPILPLDLVVRVAQNRLITYIILDSRWERCNQNNLLSGFRLLHHTSFRSNYLTKPQMTSNYVGLCD